MTATRPSSLAAARARSLAPGAAVLVAVAVAAHGVAAVVPGVGMLVVAILVGAMIANTVGTPAWAEPGIGLHTLALEVGIVLLGAQLTLGEVVASGPTVVALTLGVVVLGVLLGETLARRVFSLPERTGSLLAAGASVCGVSAVAAVARVVDADESTVAYAAGTVLLFDAVTIVAFPLAGEALGLGQKPFGVWAGLSMFSTGPVAAATFAYGEVAGRWGTVTKLVRNAFIGAVAIGYSVHYARGDGTDLRALWTEYPKFLVGFLLVVGATSAGALTADGTALLAATNDWLFALAFAGLGFDIRVGEMRTAGLRPVALVLVQFTIVSALALVAVTLVVGT
ncbi:YeiH family protein [Halomarina halobia]|uniref:YeiH family protein n=1 Tax=Halomarina halobia TaxID=3033386 RepID=A0ABD6A9J5_9EURY|nr:putative sulfate exporter family transporter [Halomarina sp. PSR21]